MKTLLKLEEAALLVVGICCFAQLDYAWWWFLLLLLVPDVGMLGYLVNPRVGAFTYNLFHFRALAIGLMIFGYFYGNEIISLSGIMLFSHIALDRMLGYGLKYPDSFKNTHLGSIGK
ncbi:DUF4260 domain-containing protein [Rasiella rasia]|uniref:DUF4260 domain-containing protein n=1 Tax=Rasiella rasia TaxID=2744027 RepID=A0A6G6GLL7_9FLAO|nr:DUF4260 domain-containing protein [Rasiella rasia]QIE59459.1 DUF4260 domain-containing protein [Rasiella rasia]